MKAVVLGEDMASVALSEVEEPELQDAHDALVRVRRAAICGSDLHVIHGRTPGVMPGSSLGHEFTGVVEAVGDEVLAVRPGDRVVGAFLIPCGSCEACARTEYAACEDQMTPGSGMFMGDLGGAQAERLRVPNADVALLRIPDALADERALFVGDILTTAYYANRLGGVTSGSTVAVQGAGPVGLLALQVARALGAARLVAVDLDAPRLEKAATLGADCIDVTRSNPGVAIERLLGSGADVVLDTVGGAPKALVQTLDLVRAGGTIAVVGLYTDPEVALPLVDTFMRRLTIRFGGLCPVAVYWRDALELVERGAVEPTDIITHRMPLDDAVEGYDLFERREALKVVLEISDGG